MHIDEEIKRNDAFWARTQSASKDRTNVWRWMAISAVLLVATASLIYGTLSFSRPEIIYQAVDNPVGTLSLAIGSVGVGLLLTMISAKMSSATFEKNKNIDPIDYYNAAKFGMTDAKLLEAVDAKGSGKKTEDKVGASTGSYAYGAASQESHFEKYISEVLRSLSAYASSAEQTAEKLLDKGVVFMTFGLCFYVFSIILWQIFANLTRPDTHVMYIGMIACSMTFVIIEFLAAWFFKQYRYYVEVSLSCLRVRSVYDRYLLGYYSLKAFKEDSEISSRDKMMDVLKEDVNWPTYKGSSSNDFNYMMESMGAAHTSLEKIRKIFKDSGKGKGKE